MRVALGYPNTYFVGMSNLGMQAVYAMLNGIPGVTCERFFLPDPEELREYRDCGRQLFTLESQRPVGDFDLVAFSVSYENDYPHLALMLDLAGLPIFSEERTADQPLVVVGGAITLLNPEPLADFVDFFALGEAEGLVGPLIEALRRGAQRDRRARLEALAQLSGFYVPSLYEPRYQDGRFAGLVATPGAPPRLEPCHRTLAAFQESPAYSQILTPDTEFGRSGLVEVSRGCPYLCRFCTVGFSYPRVRWQPVDRLWQVFENLLESTDRVGLISASVGNHPQIDDLCQRLLDRGGSVSFSSLRADRLPDSLLEALVRGGAQTLTLAPPGRPRDRWPGRRIRRRCRGNALSCPWARPAPTGRAWSRRTTPGPGPGPGRRCSRAGVPELRRPGSSAPPGATGRAPRASGGRAPASVPQGLLPARQRSSRWSGRAALRPRVHSRNCWCSWRYLRTGP